MARQQSATTKPSTNNDGRFKLDFQAELKEVKGRKAASLDMEYRLVLVTSDPAVLNLGVLDTDVLLDVEVGVSDD